MIYDDLRCLQCMDEPCQCCNSCGAGPDVACEPWCGFSDVEGMEREGVDAVENG